MSGVPSPIAGFAEKAAGPLDAVIDRSWKRDNSQVWELVNATGHRFFLKKHPTARFHEREVTAYRLWTRQLGPYHAPALVAADADLRSIVVTALPGQVATNLDLAAATEGEIHHQAGILLRRLHHAAAPSSDIAGPQRIVARTEEHLRRAGGLLEPAQVRLIRDHAAQLAEITPRLPMIPTHGDAQPRNFLWDGTRHRLALIDFERAEAGPAVRDLVRLEYGPWDGRPDLRAAFFSGYSRTLSAGEETVLQSFAALDALSAVQWGAQNNDTETAARGHRALARLAVSRRLPATRLAINLPGAVRDVARLVAAPGPGQLLQPSHPAWSSSWNAQVTEVTVALFLFARGR